MTEITTKKCAGCIAADMMTMIIRRCTIGVAKKSYIQDYIQKHQSKGRYSSLLDITLTIFETSWLLPDIGYTVLGAPLSRDAHKTDIADRNTLDFKFDFILAQIPVHPF